MNGKEQVWRSKVPLRDIAMTLAVLGCHAVGVAAFERQPVIGGVPGLAWTGAGCPSDPGGIQINPAVAGAILRRSIACTWTPGEFGLPELRRNALLIVSPLPVGACALCASTFGYDLYRELTLGATYGGTVTDGLFAGCTFSWYRLSIAGYGHASAAGIDFGLQWMPTDALRCGAVVTNLNGPSIGASHERLPQSMSSGLEFDLSPDVALAVDVVKDTRYPAELRCGIRCQPLQGLILRAGTIREPSTYTAGFGVLLGDFSLDYAFASNDQLGASHYFGVTFSLGAW